MLHRASGMASTGDEACFPFRTAQGDGQVSPEPLIPSPQKILYRKNDVRDFY